MIDTYTHIHTPLAMLIELHVCVHMLLSNQIFELDITLTVMGGDDNGYGSELLMARSKK